MERPLCFKEVFISTTRVSMAVADASPGDCAELFDYCNQDVIEAKLKLLLQMSLILIWGRSATHLVYTANFTRRQ